MSRVEDVTPELLRSWRLPNIPDDGDKEVRGRVMVLGGGAKVAGATLLTATAALRAGAGKLQIGAPRSLAQSLAIAMPEALVLSCPETEEGELAPQAADLLVEALGKCTSAAIGPGMLDEGAAGELVLRLVSADGPPMVLDAAAMRGLADSPERADPLAGRLVLTPHAGEMASLLDCEKHEVLADPMALAREAAARFKAVVVLKGAVSLIVSPDGSAWRHEAGLAGLATSGSGDVLSGVIAGLLARGAVPVQAAVWGVAAHSAAGARLSQRIARVGFLARELLDEIAPVLGEWDD